VFAKGKLVTHCANNHIPFIPFSTFDDVLATIKTWPECHVHLSHQTA
jgi:2-hydroxy-3-keto-5-methylthiopentenyl-1-phosphate phosphatase